MFSDFVIVDIETTGLKASRDEIIEISAIRIKDGKPEKKAFDQLIKTKAGYIPPEIETLTGIHTPEIEHAPELAEVMPKFKEFIKNNVICGWNINFDWSFLQKADPSLTNEIVDLLPLVKKKVPNLASYKLTSLADHFNLNKKNAHRSIFDCILTYQVMQKSGLL